MDSFERFFQRPLEEVLVSEGILPKERVDALAESARTAHEPLGKVVIETASMTPWDLAKAVSTHYQIPVHPLAGYKFDRDVAKGLPADLLHQHQIMPVSRIGRTACFAVLQPPTRDAVEELKTATNAALFFFVADGTEVRKALQDHVPLPEPMDPKADQGWQALFDQAEQEILKGLGRKT